MTLIVEYRAEWLKQFENIKEKLSGVLSGLCVRIEHIGSTSVPGLAAKPIIDVDIVYNGTFDFERIKNSLESFGYYHHGHQGIEGREVFKRNREKEDEIPDRTAHHLYVCRYDAEELHRHILFRDYLRKHEPARRFYQDLKYEIARDAKQDRKTYAVLKALKADSFISYVIELSKTEQHQSDKMEC